MTFVHYDFYLNYPRMSVRIHSQMEVRSRKVKVFAHNLEAKAYLLCDVTT